MTIFFSSDLESKINLKKLSHRHRATRDLSFSSGELTNITCRGNSSCMGKCRTERDPGPINEDITCFCDEHCMVFRDCCADYEQACLSIVNQNSSRSLNAELWQCNNHIDGVHGANGVWMISACPANWTQDDIAVNCTGNMQHMSGNCHDFAPVTDMRGNTYKNRFCALCHGVQTDTSQLYNVQNTKNASGPIPINCSLVKWKPPSGVPRRYCLEVTRNELCFNKSSRFEVYSGCLSRPPGIVMDSKANSKLYFNRFCALCSGVALDNITCGPTKTVVTSLPFPTSYNHPPPIISTGLVPIGTLLNPEEVQNIKVCQAGHVLDPVSKKCRKALGNPKPSVPFLNRYTTTIQFRSRPGCADSNHSNIIIKEALESALEHCSLEVYDIDVRYADYLIYSAHITVAFPESDVTQNIPSINCNLTIRDTPFLVIKGKWEPMLCAKIDIYKPSEYALIVDADSAVYINRTGEMIHKIDYWSNHTGTNNASVVPVGDIHVCRKTLGFNCSGVFIHLEENEYVILLNGSLYRDCSNTIYDFTTIDGKVAVCISHSSHSGRNDVALVVISYVGIGISIVCLLLVLITYSLFKELRTLPGVNLMNLCFSLLVAHSMFMAVGATRILLLCRSIAVLLHYFYLSSFVWMSIIAFDTYRTFSRICYSRQRTRKLKARFLTLGWLPALVFVVICFSLDQSGMVAIGYGGSDHCWINNANSNTFVFVIPVAFSILFNASFFFLTVNSIRKIKKQTQQVGNEANSRRNLVLFVKLAVLMGFSWIFGYLKILVSSYFDYPFVIFTPFQGIYIAFAFVFTSRVKMMYQNLLSVTTVTSSSASSCETKATSRCV